MPRKAKVIDAPVIRRAARCEDSRGLQPTVDLTGESLDVFKQRIGEAVLIASAPASLAPWTHIVWMPDEKKRKSARTYVIEAGEGWAP